VAVAALGAGEKRTAEPQNIEYQNKEFYPFESLMIERSILIKKDRA